MKTNGIRNRTAGSAYERAVAKEFRNRGFVHVVTSRFESKSRDDQGIDLVNKDEAINGRLPYNVQCKNMTGKIPYHQILSEMKKTEGIPNVLFHNQTVKAGTRFITRDQFVILNQGDFMDLIEKLENYKQGYKLLNAYFDHIPAEEQAKLHDKLLKLGLT